MKIVFIGGRDIKSIGGIENYMYNLATQLVKMGHEPIVFCESDRNEEEFVNGFRVIYQNGPKNPLLCKPWLALKATLRTVAKIKGVDFIHYNAVASAMASPIAFLLGKKRLCRGMDWNGREANTAVLNNKFLKSWRW